jgi:molecular chaperone DnaJ
MEGGDDAYEQLGVPPECSAEDIRRAYRRLAMEFHPDKTRGDRIKEERFKQVTAAYSVLSDAEQRQALDLQRQLRSLTDSMPAVGNGHGFFFVCCHRGGGRASGRQASSFHDISQLGQQGQHTSSRTSAAAAALPPVQVDVPLVLADLFDGALKVVQLDYEDTCSACGGRGVAAPSATMAGIRPCPVCGGAGLLLSGPPSDLAGLLFLPPLPVPCYECNGSGRERAPPNCQACAGSGMRSLHRCLDVRVPPAVPDGFVHKAPPPGTGGSREVMLRFVHDLSPGVSMDHKTKGDLVIKMEVPLEELLHGADRRLEVCPGRFVHVAWVGYRSPDEAPLRFPGQGLPPSGDLYVRLSPVFPRSFAAAAAAAVRTEGETNAPPQLVPAKKSPDCL